MPPSRRPWLRRDVIDDVMLCYFWFGLLNCWVTFGLLNWILLVMVCWTESLVGYASNLVAIYICLSLNLHVVYLSVLNLWLVRATPMGRPKRSAISSAFCPFGSAARPASALFFIWVGSAPNAPTHMCRRGRLAAQFYIAFNILWNGNLTNKIVRPNK